MSIPPRTLILLVLGVFALTAPCAAEPPPQAPLPTVPAGTVTAVQERTVQLAQVGDKELAGGGEEEVVAKEIADPLEPVNRAFYTFNDKLYFWILKPTAKGYNRVFPEPLRISFSHFFSNLATPIRAANCLLQVDFKGAGAELLRFGINSTMGVLGLGDAANEFGIRKREADLGQTLGMYGLGPLFYINWPFLGPSSVRDSVGYAGDYFLDPVNYASTEVVVAAKGTDRVNATSLSLGQYESLKRSAIDPYISLRNAYYQYRVEQVRKAKKRTLLPLGKEEK